MSPNAKNERSALFKDKVEANVFWLSFSVLTFLILEDLLLSSFLGDGLPGFGRYVQLYSALTVAGLISMLILYLFITSRELPYAVLIISFGTLTRLLAVNHLPWRSDVLKVTDEAARTLISGGNPYTHVFSTGPRDVFAYPPFEPIYYLPFLSVDVRYGEVFASLITLILVYFAGKFLRSKLTLPAISLYAFSGLLIASTGIGANDVSAGMLVSLATFLFIESTYRGSSKLLVTSAVVAGLAVCFKQFSIFYPFFALIYLKKRKLNWKLYVFPFLATVALISIPFLILSPLQYIEEVLLFHMTERIYSPQFILYHLLPEAIKPYQESRLWVVIYVTALLLAITFFAQKTRRLSSVVAYPTLTWLISLFLGRYLTISYFAFLAPMLCLLLLVPSKEWPS